MMKTSAGILKKPQYSNWLFSIPAVILTSIAAIYAPLTVMIFLLCSSIILVRAYKYLPVVVTIGVAVYLSLIRADTIWLLIYINTILCFSSPIISIIHKKTIDILSPWFFLPTLYWIFLIPGLALLKAGELIGINLVEPDLIRSMGIIYAFGILTLFLALRLTIKAPVSVVRKSKTSLIKRSKLNLIFKHYMIIHFILTLYFILKVGNLPIFMADMYEARLDVINLVSGYIYQIIKLIPNFASLFLFYYFSRFKQEKSLKNTTIIFFSYSFLLMVSFGWRSDPVIMLLFLVSGYHLFIQQIKLRSLIVIGITGLIALVFSDILRMGKDFSSLLPLLKMLYLTLYVDSYNLSIILDRMPAQLDFQNGRFLLLGIKMLLPGDDLNLGQILNVEFGLAETGGGMTTTIFGEWYVDFGYAGILLGIFILGIIAGKTYSWMNSSNDFFSKFIYMLVLYKVFVCIRIGLLTSIFGWLVIVMFVLLRKWCINNPQLL